MDRLTRHELKQDDFRETLDQLEQYLKAHLKEILTVAILVIVVVGLAGGLKYYLDQQEASANIELASALRTFQSYVGTVTPDTLGAESETFLNAADKHQKAREQFNAIVLKYRMFPRPKAVSIARYHVGVCESLLGTRPQLLIPCKKPVVMETGRLPPWLSSPWQASSSRLARNRKLSQSISTSSIIPAWPCRGQAHY